MHPRNRHIDGLDFPALLAASPALAAFVTNNAQGQPSLDFADPAAQKVLTAALLKTVYGVAHWDLPAGALCPSVPGRADYLHAAADLLAGDHGKAIPRGANVRAFDVGVGANCIYPLIGHAEYGWTFVGSDIDAHALAAAKKMIAANGLQAAIEVRLQHSLSSGLSGLLKPDERFDITLCNPPFHTSLKEAEEGSRRKWKNLGKAAPGAKPVLNYGGRDRELWCPGGENAFIRKLIEESAALSTQCLWFTSLVSKSAHLPALERALRAAPVADLRTLEQKQGQKTSRILAWTFQDARARAAWAKSRWS